MGSGSSEPGSSVWLLVGGRRRLGRRLAELLAEDSGLVLTSPQPWEGEAWVDALPRRAEVRTWRWDAEDPELVPRMMADLEGLRAAGLRLRSAVVVASDFPVQPFGEWTPGTLEATLRLNLAFPLLAAQAAAPFIEDGGCLQFILDTAVHRPFLKRLPYSAAKSGLAAAIPGLAALLAPRVRVVGHALGTVLPMEGTDPAWFSERSLLKRNGGPEDVARALRFAADSGFLTGEVITLDGGRRWI